jgi:hypothetical protein
MDNNHNNNFQKLEIPVVIKLFYLYGETHKLIFKFPKHERYSLGEKIESSILKSIEIFISINQISKYEKEKYLIKANSKIELLKILYRLCLNCETIEPGQYLEIEKRLQEIGRMTQGWIKYTRNNK